MNHFQQALDYCVRNSLYLGTGNPEAQVLVIGKECAHTYEKQVEDLKPYDYQFAETQLVELNLNKWQSTIEKVDDWDKNQDLRRSNFHPRFPWKGQLKKADRNENGGTSATWLNYQKLIDRTVDRQSDFIDFHDHCFLTELNQIPSAYSNQQLPELQRQRIEKRLPLFRLPFFQQFPIVVVAAGHYPREFGIDLEELFQVQWIPETIQIDQKFINIHIGASGKKILIHTNQLSINISNNLLDQIAVHCSPYINQ